MTPDSLPDPAARADALQRSWQLPYELTDLAPQETTPRWAVIADDGTLFRASDEVGNAERELEAAGPPPGRRFHWAVVAHHGDREHVLTTARGRRPFEAASTWLSGRREVDACWLLRLERSTSGVWRVLPLRGPDRIQGRRQVLGRIGILCDLGQVLVRFQRRRFREFYPVVFGQPFPEEAAEGLPALRIAFEGGELDEEAFARQALPLLHLIEFDREGLEILWAAILEADPRTVALARRWARSSPAAFRVVSDTDPWILRACRTNLGLEDLLEGAVASFQPGRRSKREGGALWMDARRSLEADGPCARVIAIDDVRSHLHAALENGAADTVIHFRHPCQLRYEMGRAGLYLPLTRAGSADAGA